MKKLGHSLERDGLSPIPTAHRDGLGTAPRPPFFLGEKTAGGSKARYEGAATVRYGVVSNRDGIFRRSAESELSLEQCVVSVDLDVRTAKRSLRNFS